MQVQLLYLEVYPVMNLPMEGNGGWISQIIWNMWSMSILQKWINYRSLICSLWWHFWRLSLMSSSVSYINYCTNLFYSFRYNPNFNSLEGPEHTNSLHRGKYVYCPHSLRRLGELVKSKWKLNLPRVIRLLARPLQRRMSMTYY